MAIDYNVEPFYDDFEATNGAKENNYMRILFRPGFAVQARELTQIQSIIQNQIKQFGDHIFTNGSPVYGGHITYDLNVPSVKLQPTYNGVDVDVDDYLNGVVKNVAGVSKVRAKVIAVEEATSANASPVLMLKYLRGTRFSDNEVLSTLNGTSEAKTSATGAIATGSVATIQTGVFYVDGFFIQVAEQSIVLSSNTATANAKVGLEIESETVDESADANLLDPAQGSFNYQAPGAHRYQVRLNLAKRALSSVDDTKFFELLRIENGVITKQVKYPIYSELEKTLARRTYDESGDYTVSPFKVSFAANVASSDHFHAIIEPGKAYVKGFEYDAVGPQVLNISKARTKQAANNFDLSLEYGNYLYANSVVGSANGFANTLSVPTLELHCVPKSNINTTGTLGYNTTFMGSAKLKHITRNSGSEFIVYLSDILLNSNTVTVVNSSVNSNSVVFPTAYSNLSEAYTNVSVRVITGGTSNASAGDVRRIVRYDGTTRTAFLDRNFTSAILTTNTVSLIYSSKDIDSLVEVVSNKAAFNVSMNVSNNSKDTIGGTILYDSNRKTLIFSLPDPQIDDDEIDDADYVTNKFIPNQAFALSGGNHTATITLTGNEKLDYGTDSQNLSSTVISQNIILVVRSLGTATGVSVGDIITPANVTRSSETTMTVFSGLNGTFNGDLYVRVKMDNSEDHNLRTKTRIGNTSNTTLTSTASFTNPTAAAVTGCTSVFIDTAVANGRVWFTDPVVINKTPGGNTSLFIPDVYKLIKVYDSGNASAEVTSTNAIDVTSSFYLDSGQNSEYYDHSKIVLKPGRNAPRGQTVVLFEAYQHSATAGYFNVDSYPDVQYTDGEIPVFKSADGSQNSLRDSIDFRPTRTAGTTANTFFGAKIPFPYEPMELSYEYYLPRRDKIILTSSKELKVLNGIPAKNPKYPADPSDSMTLFTLDIPAYTASHKYVSAKALDHKRYTMRDIGKLEQRIKNVEYYSALNMAEKKAKDSAIFYEDNATEKEKYGMVVDNFSGFEVADTKSRDFKCSVDENRLRPYVKTVNFNLIPDDKLYTTPDNPSMSKKSIWTIPSSDKIINNQTSATKNVAVIPAVLSAKFEGDVNLFPSTDHYFSVIIPPVVNSPEITILPIEPPPVYYPPPAPIIDVVGSPVLPIPDPPDVYAPIISPIVEPVILPPAPPVAAPYLPPAPPPHIAPSPPVIPPPPIPAVIFDPIPFPNPDDVGQILVLPPPPAPPTPPVPAPVFIPDFYGGGYFLTLPEIVPPPLEVIPPDVTGVAPVVSVIDTWYGQELKQGFSSGGGFAFGERGRSGGGGGGFEFEERIELH